MNSTETVMREKVLAGICPFCGAGPFHVVAGHTVRVHEVDARDLRNRCGLFYSDSITSPEYHEKKVETARRKWVDGNYGEFMGSKPGHEKDLSDAAVRLQKEKAAKLTPEIRAAAGRKTSESRRAASAERDKEILRLLDEGLLFHDIAERVGVHPVTIRMIARRHGREDDGRARYWESRKGDYNDGLRKGAEVRRANIAADGEALVASWDAGVTVYEIAEKRGVKVVAVRARLRKLGAEVPDGRNDPDRPRRTNYEKQPPWYCSVPDCDGVGRALGLCGMHYQRQQKK